MKECRECKIEKPEDDYWKVKSTEEKTRDVCIECCRKKAKERAKLNQPDLSIKEKECKRCLKTKDISEFGKRKDTSSGYRAVCKECMSIDQKVYVSKNKEWISEKGKKYRKDNKYTLFNNEPDPNVKNKKCSKCNEIKLASEFPYKKQSKDGYNSSCKKCVSKRGVKYRENNKEQIKERRRKYRSDNLEYYREYDRYRNKTKQRKEYIRKRNEIRLNTDPLFKLSRRIGGIIRDALKSKGYSKKTQSHIIIGCSKEELLEHLNNNPYDFKYGDDNLNIDHIIPLSSATTEEELLFLNHYTNLQLLPSTYNQHVKSNNPWDKEHFENWLKENPYKQKNKQNDNINI